MMPPTPLRILHLASSERWTGVAEPVVSLALGQQALGHSVWVGCIPGRSFALTAQARGLHTVPELRLNRRLNPIDQIADFLFLPRFCREHQIDIVHCHLLHDHWLASGALRRLRSQQQGRPLLVRTIHASAPPRRDWLHRGLFLRKTNALICVSADSARRTEHAFRLTPGSIDHIMGGVDLERFRPSLDPMALRGELGIPPNVPVAGLVARMRAGRGLRWMLRAVPKVLERLPDAHFIVIGRGELKKWFRAEIAKPFFRSQVHYAGYRTLDPSPGRPCASLPASYAALDLTLFLGLGSEGTCRAILEAMACGRPTLGSRLGAVPEIIEDGRTGCLVDSHDVNGLADKLSEMLGDRERLAAMGRAARLRAETLFSEESRLQAVMEIYERIRKTNKKTSLS